MSSIGLIELIPDWILIAAGLVLIGIEIIFGLFILFWFGIGLVLIGLLGFFVDFEHGEYQLIFAFAIGMVLLFALRKKVIARNNAEADQLDTYQTGEIGQLSQHNQQWMVFYHGTHWAVANPKSSFQQGQRVVVEKIESNQAWVSQIEDEN
jgi:membrane protein implicated in regulation of membrane protease activity